MRIAFISDIHGNSVALRSVLSALEDRGVGRIVCLGDICYGGPEPAECLQLIRERADTCVLGNTDEKLLECYQTGRGKVETFDEVVRWTVDSLSDNALQYIASFPVTAEIPLADQISIAAFHGSLTSNRGTFTMEDLDALSGRADRHMLYIGGHTHKPFISCQGYTGLLNPGSVGMTTLRREGRKRNLPLAYYILVTLTDRLSVEMVRQEFCLEEFKESLMRSTMPNKDYLMERWGLNGF